MAATVVCNCPTCGSVDLTVHDVELHLCDRVELSLYVFTCTCGETTARPADDSVVALLINSGVMVVHWTAPAEAFEEHYGSPLTFDDLIDFHQQLDDLGDLLAAVL